MEHYVEIIRGFDLNIPLTITVEGSYIPSIYFEMRYSDDLHIEPALIKSSVNGGIELIDSTLLDRFNTITYNLNLLAKDLYDLPTEVVYITIYAEFVVGSIITKQLLNCFKAKVVNSPSKHNNMIQNKGIIWL